MSDAYVHGYCQMHLCKAAVRCTCTVYNYCEMHLCVVTIRGTCIVYTVYCICCPMQMCTVTVQSDAPVQSYCHMILRHTKQLVVRCITLPVDVSAWSFVHVGDPEVYTWLAVRPTLQRNFQMIFYGDLPAKLAEVRYSYQSKSLQTQCLLKRKGMKTKKVSIWFGNLCKLLVQGPQLGVHLLVPSTICNDWRLEYPGFHHPPMDLTQF